MKINYVSIPLKSGLIVILIFFEVFLKFCVSIPLKSGLIVIKCNKLFFGRDDSLNPLEIGSNCNIMKSLKV